MTDRFKGFYPLSEEEFRGLWQECFFTVDANVLLHMHRYQQSTREEFLNVLVGLGDRFWVSDQAFREYHNRRLDVQKQLYKAFPEALEKLKEFEATLVSWAKSFAFRHPVLGASRLEEHIRTAFAELHEDVKSAESELRASLGDDYVHAQSDVLQRVTALAVGRIGDPFGEEDLKQIHEEAKARFSRRVPPGFKDQQKPEPNRYGDFVLWREIIDQVKRANRPVILITDDRKDDWWREHSGQTVGPRPELIQEMHDITGKQFYMYQPQVFLEWSRRMLSQEISDETLREVEAITETPEDDAMKPVARAKVSRRQRSTENRVPDYAGVLDGALSRSALEVFEAGLPKIADLGLAGSSDLLDFGLASSIDKLGLQSIAGLMPDYSHILESLAMGGSLRDTYMQSVLDSIALRNIALHASQSGASRAGDEAIEEAVGDTDPHERGQSDNVQGPEDESEE